jgi:hypothetical protein
VRSEDDMSRVRELLRLGASTREIALETGVPAGTIARWRVGRTRGFGGSVAVDPWRPPDNWSYAYLLGVYLGDGHVNVGRSGKVLLRVSLDGLYPEIVEECIEAIGLTSLGRRVQVYEGRESRVRIVQCGWKRWTEAFPQHGPGRKHERPIVLEEWQRAIVDVHAGQFVRGLIHSDGCRTVNRFTTRLPSGRVAEYAYPRYFFSNLSADIRELFCRACDRLGVRWTQSNPRNISVSHRDSVAVLEELVGPKR